MAEDLNGRLRWMERQLLAEEPAPEAPEPAQDPEELGPGYNYALDFGRAYYEGEAAGGDYVAPEGRKARPLRTFAVILLALAAIIGGYLKWLT